MNQRAVVSPTGVVAGTATRAGMLVSVASLASLFLGAGCVSNSGLLVILQNQQPIRDENTHICSAGTTPSPTLVVNGVLDLETTTPPAAYPAYFAYPLVQSALAIQAPSPGQVEPNAVSVHGVRGTIVPPPGLTVSWDADCPADFFWPTTGALLPGTMLGLTAQVIRPCQSQKIHDLFASGDLPSDLGQEVLFMIEMRVVGFLTSGSEIDSDAFHFSVRTCIGCLQTGFSDVAQFNFPNRPSCSAAPKPNPDHGNLCNPSQDYGPLLCCTDDMNHTVCPAPDF